MRSFHLFENGQLLVMGIAVFLIRTRKRVHCGATCLCPQAPLRSSWMRSQLSSWEVSGWGASKTWLHERQREMTLRTTLVKGTSVPLRCAMGAVYLPVPFSHLDCGGNAGGWTVLAEWPRTLRLRRRPLVSPSACPGDRRGRPGKSIPHSDMVLFQPALTKPGRPAGPSILSPSISSHSHLYLTSRHPSTLRPSPSHRLFSAIRSPSYNSARSSQSPISSSSLVCLVFLIKGPLTKKRQPQRCGIDWSRATGSRAIPIVPRSSLSVSRPAYYPPRLAASRQRTACSLELLPLKLLDIP
jgi:hypothetical protein